MALTRAATMASTISGWRCIQRPDPPPRRARYAAASSVITGPTVPAGPRSRSSSLAMIVVSSVRMTTERVAGRPVC